jgi:hypothetical protein
MRPAGKGREGHEFFIGTVIAYVEHCFSLPPCLLLPPL